MTFSGGLGSPCAPGTTTACPPTWSVGTVSKNSPLVTVTSGNTRSGVFYSTICAGVGLNVPGSKGTAPPAEGPQCTVGANFVVRGYCGLASATGTGTITFPSILPQSPISFRLAMWNMSATSVDHWVITGNWWRGTPTSPTGPEGDLSGFMETNPDPAGQPDACLHKAARDFLAAGAIELHNPKVLP